MNINFLLRFFLVFGAVFCVLFLFVWFYLSMASPAGAAEPPVQTDEPVQIAESVTFDKSTVQLRSRYGSTYHITVEVAASPEQLAQGLMHRTELPAGTGMLFVYKLPRKVSMWMKDTLIPLDMLFASRKGTFFHIAENTTPMSEELITAPGATAYVLELPAGTVEKLGIQVGDRLVR